MVHENPFLRLLDSPLSPSSRVNRPRLSVNGPRHSGEYIRQKDNLVVVFGRSSRSLALNQGIAGWQLL
jgi:hypothetical protein